MTSAIEACEAALYDALAAGVTLGTVYQHVPENTPPPVVILGDLSAEDASAKDDDDEAFTVEIVSLIMDEQRAPLLALQGEVKACLHGARLKRDGFSFRPLFQGSDGQLMPDGETYYGSQTFRVVQAD